MVKIIITGKILIYKTHRQQPKKVPGNLTDDIEFVRWDKIGSILTRMMENSRGRTLPHNSLPRDYIGVSIS